MSPARGDMIDLIVQRCKPGAQVRVILTGDVRIDGDVVDVNDYTIELRWYNGDKPPTIWTIDVHRIIAFAIVKEDK